LGDAGGAIGCPDGDDALDTGLDPDDTGLPDILFGGDADEGETQPVQRMSWVNNFDCVRG
jgi:hypothetical protein